MCHHNFSLIILPNPLSLNLTLLIIKGAFETEILYVESTILYLESREIIKFLSWALISKLIVISSDIITGLTFKLCGATGVIIKLLDSDKRLDLHS